jgi:hypothetical protein
MRLAHLVVMTDQHVVNGLEPAEVSRRDVEEVLER